MHFPRVILLLQILPRVLLKLLDFFLVFLLVNRRNGI